MIRLTVALCIDAIVGARPNEIVPRQALAQPGEAVEPLPAAGRPARARTRTISRGDARPAPGRARRAAHGSPGDPCRERSGSRTGSASARGRRDAAAHGCRPPSCPAPARCRRGAAAAPARPPAARAASALARSQPAGLTASALPVSSVSVSATLSSSGTAAGRPRRASAGRISAVGSSERERGQRIEVILPALALRHEVRRRRRARRRRRRRDARGTVRRPARWPTDSSDAAGDRNPDPGAIDVGGRAAEPRVERDQVVEDDGAPRRQRAGQRRATARPPAAPPRRRRGSTASGPATPLPVRQAVTAIMTPSAAASATVCGLIVIDAPRARPPHARSRRRRRSSSPASA